MKKTILFSLILTAILSFAGITASAQSATLLRQKCVGASTYSIVQVTAVGDIVERACSGKSNTESAVTHIQTDVAGTAQFSSSLTPSNASGAYRVGDCVTTATACLMIDQTTNEMILGNGVTGGATTLNLKGVASSQLNRTITPALTVGAQTINKQAGTVNFAAAAASLVVTNNTVTTTSIVTPVIRTADATCTFVKSVVPASGSFTITLNAACGAETSVGFVVWN